MRRDSQAGFASMPMVAALGLLLTLSLTMVFRTGLMRRDQAAKTQLRLDYHEREEAVLRALVAVFPKKAIACMRANYTESDAYSWSAIFAEAIAVASASESLPPEVESALALERVRRGDVADNTVDEVRNWVTSLTGEPGRVTPGTTAFAEIFRRPEFAGKVPPLLLNPAALQEADAVRPVVSLEKRYASQDAGLLAGIANYSRYNLIPYPNIRFGYAVPGQPFVAKRNWWAFSIRYGGERSVTRHYVLSLYEVPSQLPIEASTFAEIGRHADGSAWSAGISIDGGVYADSLLMDGAHGASRLSGRRSIQLPGAMDVGGTLVDGNFDALGERERLQADARSRTLPVALSANSGRVVFFPLPSGTSFLNRPAAAPDGWQAYVGGAVHCRVTVQAVAMVSHEDQTPTSLRVRYQLPGGSTGEAVLTRGVNWPAPLEAGGAAVPFQTELTNSNRSCLTFYPSLLNAWLADRGGASVAVNHSVYFAPDPSANPLTVRTVSSPPSEDDMCVIVRKGKDLRDFTSGLSIVAPLRVYIGDDLNDVPSAAPPTGSGLPAGTTFYPPMSIFAAELRVGTTAFNRPFEHHGQVGTLQSGGVSAWRPLDVKSGTDDLVHSNEIEASLEPLRSPAELPPVHQMNWMVVIEEIPPQ